MKADIRPRAPLFSIADVVNYVVDDTAVDIFGQSLALLEKIFTIRW